MPLFLNFFPFSLFPSLSHSSYIFPFLSLPLSHILAPFSLFLTLSLLSFPLSFSFSRFHPLSLPLSRTSKKSFYANSAFILSFKYHLTSSQVPLLLPLADGRRFFFFRNFPPLLTASVLHSFLFFGFSCNL